jgi:gluconate 2-dehydrogenase gamma chain
MSLCRRDFLATTAYLISGGAGRSTPIRGEHPWEPNAGVPLEPARPGSWHYFTGSEGAAIAAIAERIIPPDPATPAGKVASYAVFIDRQLAGPCGRQKGFHTQPFLKGSREQGLQSETGPTQQYRSGLAALERYCRGARGGKAFAKLPDARHAVAFLSEPCPSAAAQSHALR